MKSSLSFHACKRDATDWLSKTSVSDTAGNLTADQDHINTHLSHGEAA